MANLRNANVQVFINNAVKYLDTTFYGISVHVQDFTWKVYHRYKEFHELHNYLLKLKDFTLILKNITFPNKKIFRNSEAKFIESRREKLEEYLTKILHEVPDLWKDKEFAYFLDLNKYELNWIQKEFADSFQKNEVLHVDLLKLCAITRAQSILLQDESYKRLKRFCGQVKSLVIKRYPTDGGLHISNDNRTHSNDEIGQSNIKCKDLSCNLSIFKTLEELHAIQCNIRQLGKLSTIRHRLRIFCYMSFEEAIDFGSFEFNVTDNGWTSLEELSLRGNNIEFLSDMKTLYKLTKLDLTHNCISQLSYLKDYLLSQSIHELYLRKNKIKSLEGLDALCNLRVLDLSANEISNIQEIRHIQNLKSLNKLTLRDNPIAKETYYRGTVFLFLKRTYWRSFLLDDEKYNGERADTEGPLMFYKNTSLCVEND